MRYYIFTTITINLLAIVIKSFCYKIVDIVNNNGSNVLGSYLLHDDIYRKIPDNETKIFMMKSIPVLNDVLTCTSQGFENRFIDIKIGADIQSMNIPSNNADNILLRNIILFETMQGTSRIMEKVLHLPSCFNPSIAPWKGQYLVVCRSSDSLGGPIKIGWLSTDFKMLDTSYYGLAPGINAFANLNGEDYRILEIDDDHILLMYVFYPDRRYAKIKYAIISIDSTKQQIQITDNHLIYIDESRGKLTEKNWTPFMYDRKCYFIRFIHNMSIVTVTPLSNLTSLSVINKNIKYLTNIEESPEKSPLAQIHPYSYENPMYLKWDYGEIRGGTPARRISEDSYLAFFHSKSKLRDTYLITYFWGAYTFTSKPPFTIQKMSLTPLVLRDFYEGRWSHDFNYVDYIVYPMSFVITGAYNNVSSPSLCNENCRKNSKVMVSIGIQDIDGYIVEINLQNLLETLVPVVPKHYV